MKKFLLSLVCLLTMALPSLAATKTYQLVTDADEILNPENQFIIVSANTFSGSAYAVTTGFDGTPLESSLPSLTPEVLKNVEVEGKTLGSFRFEKNGDVYALYECNEGKYWGSTGKTTGTTSSKTLPSDAENAKKYQLTVDIDPQGRLTISSAALTGRLFGFGNKGPNFKYYTTNNISGGGDYAYPLFYKELVVGPQNPEYKGFEEEYTLEIDQSMPLPKIFPSELNYTFTTEDTDIVKIDNETKTITALAEGSALIDFSTEATDAFYAGEGGFFVNVTKKTPKLSFTDQIVYGKLNVGVVWQVVTVDDPENADERGVITYTSSNTDILDVDPETGQIHPSDVHAKGEAIVTATMAEMGKYAAGSASYKILIKDPEETIEPGTVVFDFTEKDAYGLTSRSDSKYETEVREIESDDIVTISFEGNYRSFLDGKGNYDLRLASKANGSFTVSVPDGYRISLIGMTGNYVNGNFDPLSSSNDFNEFPEEWESLKSYWHSEAAEPINSVTFSTDKDITNTIRIDKIFVLYEAANSGLKSARLSFDKVVNGIIVDEEATINAVINPTGREITYGIQNLSEEEYSITPSEDGKTLKVIVNTPGYYTLEAKSTADDVYRDGYAIMRLNVFRHLDVFANEIELTEDIISTEDDVELTFNVPELTNVYYQIVEDGVIPGEGEEEIDENQEAGFELYEDGIFIPANTRGKLVFYIANYGYKSPKRTIVLDAPVVVEAPAAPVLKVNGVVFEEETINGTDTVKVNFEAPKGIEIYYNLVTGETEAPKKAHGEADHAGYTLHNGEEVELNNTHIGLSFYACDPATGLHSDTTTYTVGIATGVNEIEATDADAIYFNLQGVQISKPENGVYIRVKKGQTEKIVK